MNCRTFSQILAHEETATTTTHQDHGRDGRINAHKSNAAQNQLAYNKDQSNLQQEYVFLFLLPRDCRLCRLRAQTSKTAQDQLVYNEDQSNLSEDYSLFCCWSQTIIDSATLPSTQWPIDTISGQRELAGNGQDISLCRRESTADKYDRVKFPRLSPPSNLTQLPLHKPIMFRGRQKTKTKSKTRNNNTHTHKSVKFKATLPVTPLRMQGKQTYGFRWLN